MNFYNVITNVCKNQEIKQKPTIFVHICYILYMQCCYTNIIQILFFVGRRGLAGKKSEKYKKILNYQNFNIHNAAN